MNAKTFGVFLFLSSACAMAHGGVSAVAGSDWIPVHDSTAIAPGSALDFSSFSGTGAPAGRLGRVVARGSHFEFEKLPGVPQRFYGVNLCFTANYMTAENASELCRRLRLTGYNALRVHHYERTLCEGSADGTAINPARMAELDNLLNACIEHGIYLTTDLFVSRVVPYRSCGIDKDGAIAMDEFKELAVFHEGTRSNLVAFTRQLLGHVNPKTGRRWAEEPALAWISLVNEGNPGNHGWRKSKAWLGLPEGLSDAEMTKRAVEKEIAFCRFMKKELRDLGFKGLVTDMNCWHNPPEYQKVRAEYDYVDDHFYVDHPRFLEKSWRLPSKNDNRNPLRYSNRGVEWNFPVRLADKPFTLTEYNFSGPGVYRGIGGILFGAGAALQDVDGIWRFAWSHGADAVLDERPANYFDVARDPLVRATERAIIALFLRGDMPVDRAVKAAEDAGSATIPAGSSRVLACDRANGAFCVNTPLTAGGFAEAGGSFGCGALSAAVRGAPAAVWATSLDGNPLKSSARILLAHVTDLQDTGVVYRDDAMKILEKWGGLPHLMRRGAASCRLAADGPRVVQSLNADGTRRFKVPCAYDREKGEIALELDVGAEPCEATFQYEIVPADGRERPKTDPAPFVFHLDFNVSALNRDAIVRTLDHVARQGCNAILWEIENAVKFDCCPEVASPDAFTKDEFRGILAHAAKLGLEPVPLMQTFGHGEYVLAHDRFKPLRERPDRKDCYCSSNPETRKFLKALLHEYLDLFGPGVRRFHLGGDEAWVYRSCAKCKARKPAELYFEHLEAVAEELRAKGIRPGVWHDMLRRFDETGAVYADLPENFAIWYWDYGTFENGAWARGQEAALRRERAKGRDVIYCGSIRSFIDSPFFVRYGFHRANLAESIDWCRKEKLSGYCVTSWAIHQGPLELQRPLIDFAAKRWLDPGADADADWRGIVARHFGDGVTAEDLDALTDWNMGLFGADARFGTYKDGALPPPGGIAERVAKWGAGEAERTAAVVRALSEKAAKPAAALRRARAAHASPFVDLALEAAELKIAYQNMMADALSGTNAAAAAFPRERALRFYRRELGERSAHRCVERITRLYGPAVPAAQTSAP